MFELQMEILYAEKYYKPSLNWVNFGRGYLD
jgi:hypothetical protein